MKIVRKVWAFLLVSALSVSAQQQMASVTGRITDFSGASVPGARVTITDAERDTTLVVTSNDNGDYTFPQVLRKTTIRCHIR